MLIRSSCARVSSSASRACSSWRRSRSTGRSCRRASAKERGWRTARSVGQTKFRCDLAVHADGDSNYRLAILVDSAAHYGQPNILEKHVLRQSVLRAFGWECLLVLTKDWFHEPESVLSRIERLLRGEALPEDVPEEDAYEQANDGSVNLQPSEVPGSVVKDQVEQAAVTVVEESPEAVPVAGEKSPDPVSSSPESLATPNALSDVLGFIGDTEELGTRAYYLAFNQDNPVEDPVSFTSQNQREKVLELIELPKLCHLSGH